MVLVVDPQIAGISGDMFLCALVDMGANKKTLIDGVVDSARFLDNVVINSMAFEPTVRNGTRALELNVDIQDDSKNTLADVHSHTSRKGSDMAHAIKNASNSLGLSDESFAYASRCIGILLDSESHVHGVGIDSVTLHEASHADTLVDIIGSAIALDDLGLFEQRMVCLPVCVGGGFVKFSHGTVSNPAGAILEVFKKHGLVMRGSSAGYELTTPTGACMLAALEPESVGFYPCMDVDSIGYGAGTMDSNQFANVLKLVCGAERTAFESVYNYNYNQNDSRSHTNNNMPLVTTHLYGHRIEHVCILETNVDDVSGEVLGGLIKKMMNAGAKDVTICPGITKKNRPTNLISVICDNSKSKILVDLLVSETGTLGVRVSDSARIVIPRKQYTASVDVDGKTFSVRYKRVMDDVNLLSVKYTGEHNKHTGSDIDDDSAQDNHSTDVCENNDYFNNTSHSAFKIEFDDVQSVSDALCMTIKDTESILRTKIEKIIAGDVHKINDACDDNHNGSNDSDACNKNDYDGHPSKDSGLDTKI